MAYGSRPIGTFANHMLHLQADRAALKMGDGSGVDMKFIVVDKQNRKGSVCNGMGSYFGKWFENFSRKAGRIVVDPWKIMYCVVRRMNMKDIKKVTNPLTIIAIFAALAEIAGTGVLLGLNVDLQKVFIWFVMLFPILLVGLFFVTLNYNPKVLYAPSDFTDENNFLNLFADRIQLENSLSEVSMIVAESKEVISNDSNESKDLIIQNLNEKIQTMQNILNESNERHSVLMSDATLENSLRKLPFLQFKALSKICEYPEGISLDFWRDRPSSLAAIEKLIDQGLIQISDGKATAHEIIRKALS